MAALAIALSIPVFFVLIMIELIASRVLGRKVYRFNDAITCLSCGVGQQVTHLTFAGLELAIYLGVAAYAVLPVWPADTWWTWLLALVLYDHQYYWWHRTTHRSNLFWTTHVGHHQSEDYNLAVALRQTWFSAVSGLPFYLPLAWLGVPLDMFIVIALVDLLYQFWIHTELVPKLGPFEWVMNTPSHHRVHHAVNPMYIDKNYAAVFIVWDRLYGTFVEETIAPTYGVVEPLRSFDPIHANTGPLRALVHKVRRMPDWRSALYAVIAPPEWRPASQGGPVQIPEPEPRRVSWDPVAVPEVNAYILVQFILVGAWAGAMLTRWPVWDGWARATSLGSILLATWTWGALFERRVSAPRVELGRLGLLLVAGVAITRCDPLAPWAFGVAFVVAVLSAAWWARPAVWKQATT